MAESGLEIASAIPTSTAELRLRFYVSCQVCWRTMRWHNGPTPALSETRNRKKSYETALLMGKERSAFHPGQELPLQRRPYTFAQTNLSLSLFACDKAADHTFRFAGDPPGTATPRNAFRHADCRRILTVYQRARFFFVCRNRIGIEAGCGDHYVPSIKISSPPRCHMYSSSPEHKAVQFAFRKLYTNQEAWLHRGQTYESVWRTPGVGFRSICGG